MSVGVSKRRAERIALGNCVSSAIFLKDKNIVLGRSYDGHVVGGVVTLTESLIKTKVPELQILDLYGVESSKRVVASNLSIIYGKKICRYLCMYFILCFNRKTVFFNGSTPISLLMNSIAYKQKGAKWVTVLHNGDLQARFDQQSRFVRFMIRIALKRVDQIFYISDLQLDFYRNLVPNIAASKITPTVTDASVLPSCLGGKAKGIAGDKFTIVGSGYPTKIYRHLETISLLSKIHDAGYSFTYNLFLYGADTDEIKDEIIKQSNELDFVHVFDHVTHGEFIRVLGESQLYLRLNSVDSFGIAIVEAMQVGATVICTDVCERQAGAYLVEKDGFELAEEAVMHLISEGDLITCDIRKSNSPFAVPYDAAVVDYIKTAGAR